MPLKEGLRHGFVSAAVHHGVQAGGGAAAGDGASVAEIGRAFEVNPNGQALAGTESFVVNFPGGVKMWKEPFEEVEAAKLRQNNQRG